jgi:hypothetical protein
VTDSYGFPFPVPARDAGVLKAKEDAGYHILKQGTLPLPKDYHVATKYPPRCERLRQPGLQELTDDPK